MTDDPPFITASEWMRLLDLFREPYVQTTTIAMNVSMPIAYDPSSPSFIVAGDAKVEVTEPLAPWAFAVYQAANAMGDVQLRQRLSLWRAFILTIERLPDVAASIESVMRLGTADQTNALVFANLAAFEEGRAKATPVMNGLSRLYKRRARRLDGRAERVPDGLYMAEAARGRPVSKRLRFGAFKKR